MFQTPDILSLGLGQLEQFSIMPCLNLPKEMLKKILHIYKNIYYLVLVCLQIYTVNISSIMQRNIEGNVN